MVDAAKLKDLIERVGAASAPVSGISLHLLPWSRWDGFSGWLWGGGR